MRTTQGGKKQEMKHRRREGSKKNKDKISSRKIDHRILWFFWSKITDTEMIKKWVKKKYEKRSRTKEREREKWGKTEEDTQKRRWRKKVKETWDREKRERETLRQEIKKEWRKERREKGEKSKKGWTKEWKGKVNKEKSDDRNREHVERWKRNKKGRNKNKKWRFFFLADFFLWFKAKGEKDLKKTKIEENLTVFFFSHAMFFKPREQKQKTIESFPTFSSKKKVLLSGYIKKKGE